MMSSSVMSRARTGATIKECVAVCIHICPQSNPVQLGIQVLKWPDHGKIISNTRNCTTFSYIALLKLQHILSLSRVKSYIWTDAIISQKLQKRSSIMHHVMPQYYLSDDLTSWMSLKKKETQFKRGGGVYYTYLTFVHVLEMLNFNFCQPFI